MIPIIDFHCDLLGCIESNEQELDFCNPDTNCSIPQLLSGGVCIQTLALFAPDTSQSVQKATKQLEIYENLLSSYQDKVRSIQEFQYQKGIVYTILAIESASCLATKREPLEKAFLRFNSILEVEKVLYISLTWNHENRFGGGNLSTVGIKEDGIALLQYLSEKNIAIDLSHTSDALAFDILNTIDKYALKITPIASHSNFRSIKNMARNLPDELAQEIIKRNGLIGMNLIRDFIGDDPHDFIRHFQHGVQLGGERNLCLGSDFFGGIKLDLPNVSFPIFQKDFDHAGQYQHYLDFLISELGKDLVQKIAFENASQWMQASNIIETNFIQSEL